MEVKSFMLLKNNSKTLKELFVFLPFAFLSEAKAGYTFWVFCLPELWVLKLFQGKICVLRTSVCLPAYLKAWPIHNWCTGNIHGKNEWVNGSYPTLSSFLTVSWRYFQPPRHLPCPFPLSTCKLSLSFKIQLIILWNPLFKTELNVLLGNLIQSSTIMQFISL